MLEPKASPVEQQQHSGLGACCRWVRDWRYASKDSLENTSRVWTRICASVIRVDSSSVSKPRTRKTRGRLARSTSVTKRAGCCEIQSLPIGRWARFFSTLFSTRNLTSSDSTSSKGSPSGLSHTLSWSNRQKRVSWNLEVDDKREGCRIG